MHSALPIERILAAAAKRKAAKAKKMAADRAQQTEDSQKKEDECESVCDAMRIKLTMLMCAVGCWVLGMNIAGSISR